MAIRPVQPQSIGDVLDTSFRLYKASIGSVWPLCFILVLGSVPVFVYTLLHGSVAPDPTDPLAALAMFSTPGYWLSTALGMLIALLGTGALYLKLHAIGVGDDLSTGAAVQGALSRVLVLFAMWIMFMAAVVVGCILLLVPGMVLGVSLLLGTNLAMLENKGPLTSLVGSHLLVWGHWWRTATILTVGFIILAVIYVALGFILSMALPFIGMAAEDMVMVGQVGGVVVTAIVNLLVTPFYIALLIAVYWDLKLRREGADLAARVGALGTA